ncbi:MAG TPA: hypothetical protein VF753_03940 [Terriglobales bacterium]
MAQRKSHTNRRRRVFTLSSALEKRLGAYAGAAAAAGVSVLAIARSAEAKIVYTPANTTILVNGRSIPLDLNHDGITDFSFSNRLRTFTVGASYSLNAEAPAGNAIRGRGSFRGGWRSGPFASAIQPGIKVGPDKSRFGDGPGWLMGYSVKYAVGPSSTFRSFGQWLNTTRYLGLQFLIDGQIHYGWARFTVGLPQNVTDGIPAKLTGYAYETIPNKPILTGQTEGLGADATAAEPATLGRLAQGASAIPSSRCPP